MESSKGVVEDANAGQKGSRGKVWQKGSRRKLKKAGARELKLTSPDPACARGRCESGSEDHASRDGVLSREPSALFNAGADAVHGMRK